MDHIKEYQNKNRELNIKMIPSIIVLVIMALIFIAYGIYRSAGNEQNIILDAGFMVVVMILFLFGVIRLADVLVMKDKAWKRFKDNEINRCNQEFQKLSNGEICCNNNNIGTDFTNRCPFTQGKQIEDFYEISGKHNNENFKLNAISAYTITHDSDGGEDKVTYFEGDIIKLEVDIGIYANSLILMKVTDNKRDMKLANADLKKHNYYFEKINIKDCMLWHNGNTNVNDSNIIEEIYIKLKNIVNNEKDVRIQLIGKDLYIMVGRKHIKNNLDIDKRLALITNIIDSLTLYNIGDR